MRIDIKHYLEVNNLTIYQVSKRSGYGYTTLHKSFNKPQSSSTSLNLRDLDALSRAQHKAMWHVLRELETHYLERDSGESLQPKGVKPLIYDYKF